MAGDHRSFENAIDYLLALSGSESISSRLVACDALATVVGRLADEDQAQVLKMLTDACIDTPEPVTQRRVLRALNRCIFACELAARQEALTHVV